MVDKLKRIALIEELRQYLESRGHKVEQEVVFSKIMNSKRRFRADFYTQNRFGQRIIIEINGGQWISGRHNRGGAGYERDLTKMNLAQYHGFKYYQFTYEMLQRQEYKEYF